jgi:hypothetical protein
MPSPRTEPGASLIDTLIGSARNERLFLILDAAQAGDPRPRARQFGVPCQSLYSGPSGDRLADVAPYILATESRRDVLQWFAQQWGTALGIALRSPSDMAPVRAHLRRSLTVAQPQARDRYLFRFYDPRVLRAFLPACTPDELRQFFGPLTALYCESDDGREMLSYTLTGAGLSVRRTWVPAFTD